MIEACIGGNRLGKRYDPALAWRAALVLAAGMVVVVPPTPALAQIAAPNGVGSQFELAFWQSIDSTGDPGLYEAYLARFPAGTFSEIARAKIQALRARPAVQQVPQQAQQPTTTAPLPPSAVTAAPVMAEAPAVPPSPVMAVRPTPVSATAPVQMVQVPVVEHTVYVPPPPPPPPPPPAQTVAPVTQTALVAPAPPPVAAVLPPPPAVAVVEKRDGKASAASANTLGQLLAALANTQGSGHGTGAADQGQPGPTTAANGGVVNASYANGTRRMAAGFALPAAPLLTPVPAVPLPAGFCSGEARNEFHDTVYVRAVDLAKANNDASVAHMKHLQALYDQYQLSHDPDTMNEIAAAAHEYQPIAQAAFQVQAALVQQFRALMAVPMVTCATAQMVAK